MANISFSASATFSISGITPAEGPKSTVRDSGTYASGAIDAGDHVVRTLIVNAVTTATAIDMGKIVTGNAIWIESDGDLTVTLTQDFGAGPVTNNFLVSRFLMLHSSFTAVSIANPGADAIHVSLMLAGDRATASGPGVF